MMIAAMPCGSAWNAALISSSDWRSAASTRASSAASTGKRSAGLLTRGQSKRAKYWYLRGSAVFVIDTV